MTSHRSRHLSDWHELLRDTITAFRQGSAIYDSLKDTLLSDYGITIWESREKIDYFLPTKTDQFKEYI